MTTAVLEIRKNEIRESLRDFQGVEHRLEYVATVRNVRFVNDSKATNVNACWYALQSMKTPTVLILGGADNSNDYREIEKLVHEKVRALVFLGVDNASLRKFFSRSGKQILEVQTMDDAVKTAYELAHEGDTVLLSPCSEGMDLFENFEDRGRQFKQCVRNL
jgi:UDP-N-acetylmuramoylalanine--D-glutamate ligase